VSNGEPINGIVHFRPEMHAKMYKDFIRDAYGRDDYVLLSDRYLKWQFLDNPFNGTSDYTLKLFIKDGHILGQIGLIPVTVKMPGNHTTSACYPVNLVVRPEMRSLGIGFFLLKDSMRDYGMFINPGSSADGEKVCKGLGMKPMGCLNRYVYILSKEKARLIFNGDITTLNKFKNERHGKAALTEESLAFSLPSEDVFQAFGIDYFPYHVIRDREFLTWRYIHHPFFQYRFIFSDDNKGLLIYREEIEPATGIKVWRIIEFVAAQDNCKNLLERIIDKAFDSDVTMIDFICSFLAYDNAFKSEGFLSEDVDAAGGFAYLFQPLDFRKTGIRLLISDIENMNYDMNRWYITKGDSDQDRPNYCYAY
jgi:GNAT superfamily N-acetyltransferase